MASQSAASADERQGLAATVPGLVWLAMGLLLLLLLVPAAVTWFQALSNRAMTDNLVQAMVIILLGVAVYRSGFRARPRYCPSWVGFGFLSGAGLLYLLGVVLSIKALMWGMVPLLIAGLGWALFGFRFVYSWLPLLIFSFFLLPDLPSDLRNSISLPLQLLSTQLTVWMAGLIIPITAQGNIFLIRGEAFEVTVACSGLHTWLGFLFAGLLWMLFERFSPRAFVAILLGAPVLALLLNSIRLLITALVAYYGSADMAVAVHTNLEYGLFPLGLLLMGKLGQRIYAAEAQKPGLSKDGCPNA